MAGEEFYAEIKRSTNGGGENSPALEGGLTIGCFSGVKYI